MTEIISLILCFSVGFLVAFLYACFTAWIDNEKNIQDNLKIAVIAGVSGAFIARQEGFAQQIVICVANAVLLFAAYTDNKKQEIYRITWALPMGIALMGMPHTKEAMLGLVFFATLQLLLFSRFYGKADSFAFCLCAGALSTVNGKPLDYLIQMLIALVLLLFINLWKHNVDRKLKLKKPVPFIPYIYTSWIIITILLIGGVRYVSI